MGIVTDYVIQLIQRQVNEKGIVVWFDPHKVYVELVSRLSLLNTRLSIFGGSYLKLRHDVDDLMNDVHSETPPRLVIYVPLGRTATEHILDEFVFAGVVMQPGESLPRNTNLEVVARHALKTIFTGEKLDEICVDIRKGRIHSLDDLDKLAEQGTPSTLGLIFGTGQPMEIAFKFLTLSDYDQDLIAKSAIAGLSELLAETFGLDLPSQGNPEQARILFQRHLLISEFQLCLAGESPSSLVSIRLPETDHQKEACLQIVDAWRNRRDLQQHYIEAAQRIEVEFGLGSLEFDLEALRNIHTFPGVEMRLQVYVEEELILHPTRELVDFAHHRRTDFWGETDEQIGARWALIATAGDCLLTTETIQAALKTSPPVNAVEYVQRYTQMTDGWCQLDTYHRTLERLALLIDFDPHGAHASLERLLARTRQEYSRVVDGLSRAFLAAYANAQFELGGILYQNEVFARYVAPQLSSKKTAYVLVDALRFEMAQDLAASLEQGWQFELTPAIAIPPTLTVVGMAALLPGAERGISLANVGELAVEIGGHIFKDRKDRVIYLGQSVEGLYEVKLEMLVPAKKATREAIRSAKFILVTSQEIDLLGEGDSIAQAREFMDSALSKLARAFRVLSDLGIERIVVSADHGYIFGEELDADMTIPTPGGQTVGLHRRIWIGKGGQALEGVLRTTTQALNLGGDFELATPMGLACFAAPGGKAYFHGGLSLQELIVPVLVLQPVTVSLPLLIDWSFKPSRDKITTRFFSAQIQGLVGTKDMFEVKPPLVRVEIRAGNKPVSSPVTATYGFQDATGEVQMQWKTDAPFELEPNTVALMLIGEVSQKVAKVLLIDAETEKTLKEFEIEVAISI